MKKKHWEDAYIGGEPGYWYTVIGDVIGGYFHYLKDARAHVRRMIAR